MTAPHVLEVPTPPPGDLLWDHVRANSGHSCAYAGTALDPAQAATRSYHRRRSGCWPGLSLRSRPILSVQMQQARIAKGVRLLPRARHSLEGFLRFGTNLSTLPTCLCHDPNVGSRRSRIRASILDRRRQHAVHEELYE